MTPLPAPPARRDCLRRLAVLGLLLALAGCDATDPFLRPGMWRPAGISDMNFETQAAVPADLRRGRGTATVDGDTAAAPVDRLRRDRSRPLPSSGISSVGASGGAAPAGGN